MKDIHYEGIAMSTAYEIHDQRPVINRDVVVVGAGPAG